jgi:shikimate kinase
VNGPRQLYNIALIGFMGTGKSSVGRLAATQLHYDFVDTDELIEKRAGKTIAEIFGQEGETSFREAERRLVAEMAGWRRSVISTGGGLAACQDNLTLLKQHSLVVCLCASPGVIWERLRHQNHRPLLQAPDPLDRIRTLLAERMACYRQADVLINTGMRSVREVTQQLLHQFHIARTRDPQ